MPRLLLVCIKYSSCYIVLVTRLLLCEMQPSKMSLHNVQTILIFFFFYGHRIILVDTSEKLILYSTNVFGSKNP